MIDDGARPNGTLPAMGLLAMSLRYTTAQLAVVHGLFERPDLLSALRAQSGEDLEADLPEAMRSLLAARALELDVPADDLVDEPDDEEPAVRLLDPHLMVLEVVMSPDQLIAVEHDGVDEDAAWFIQGDRVVQLTTIAPDVHELVLTTIDGLVEAMASSLGVAEHRGGAEPQAEVVVEEATVARLRRSIERGDRSGIADALGAGVSEALIDTLVDPLQAGQLTVLTTIGQSGTDVSGEQWSFVNGGDNGWWLVDGDGESGDPISFRRCESSELVTLLRLPERSSGSVSRS